jgi:TonB family protein
MLRFRASRRHLTVAALLLLPGALLVGGARTLRAEETAPAAEQPRQIGGAVTRPEKISGGVPVYTEAARKARVMGIVIVEAIIDEKGNVANARVLRGLPLGLDQAVLDAIRTWKFKPAALEGKPVKVYYTLTVNFQVEDTPPFGPLFRELLGKKPDFAKLLLAKRYGEAGEIVDRWAAERPDNPEIALARCYLSLLQGRLDAAWQAAMSYRAPDPYEVLYMVGAFAWNRAVYDRTLNREKRAEAIELGLQAETAAMAARADGYEAAVYKSLLLREKAKASLDPSEQQALAAEAIELQTQATELRAKSRQDP